ncbi:MAG: M3 family oligoendopeptidase [Chitinophagales bacterium]
MKFNDFNYQRPDIKQLENDYTQLINAFKAADNAASQIETVNTINQLRGAFDTMYNLAYIRYSQNTANEAYEAEQSFFDSNIPHYKNLENKFYKALVNSKFRPDLEAHWGKQLFDLAEAQLGTFHPDLIEDLQRENQLSSEYTKLIASAKLIFEGEERNLSQMIPFETSVDRAMRKKAAEAKWSFFAAKQAELDNIYHEMVQLRHKMAVKLGYKSYVELAYKKLKRTDYNAEMVATYRQQVKDVVVPIAMKLRERQAKRLGLDGLKYYDIPLSFKTGNPTPKGSPEWIVDNGVKMYDDLSSETSEFFHFMLDNDLMDLVTRKNKASGGYCTYVNDYKAPFIFSNFNGTAGDINVLTHEAGHAFQVYMSRDFDVPEYNWPTYEACEIHSMSMEFFAWPWMDNFFEEDVTKFKFFHLNDSILFLPYGVAVDEFQHFVYENPNITPTERRQGWRNIEKKYLPWIDYEDNDYLENGGYWQKQSHIFGSPFYYIDYTLAQVCAFQFWHKANENQKSAFADYVRLCKAGGSQPFLNLVEYANLDSPFNQGCIKTTLKPIEAFLAEIDDSQM